MRPIRRDLRYLNLLFETRQDKFIFKVFHRGHMNVVTAISQESINEVAHLTLNVSEITTHIEDFRSREGLPSPASRQKLHYCFLKRVIVT